jgi:hypothetical protein
MIAAECVGANGRVLCIEPDPANHPALHLNMASLPNVGGVSIIRAEPDTVTQWGVQRRLRLDDLLANLTRIDVLRLDGRCCTRPAVDGLRRTLMAFQPLVMVDGTANHLTAANRVQVEGWLRAYGYHRLPDMTGADQHSISGGVGGADLIVLSVRESE